jgi:hypothetical protein
MWQCKAGGGGRALQTSVVVMQGRVQQHVAPCSMGGCHVPALGFGGAVTVRVPVPWLKASCCMRWFMFWPWVTCRGKGSGSEWLDCSAVCAGTSG